MGSTLCRRSVTQNSMTAMADKNDVALLYHDERHDESRIAGQLREALEKNHHLKVKSYDDLKLGPNKKENRRNLIENSWCVVLILTDCFVDSAAKLYEAKAALDISSKSHSENVFLINYLKDKSMPDVLEEYEAVKGGSMLCANQALKIHDSLNSIKQERFSKDAAVGIKIKGYVVKALHILDLAVTSLDEHFEIDDKMEGLHAKMKGVVDSRISDDSPDQEQISTDSGCSCSRGELWKREIIKPEYWAGPPLKPKEIKNIKKHDDPRKHTDDIHKLYGPGGHFKLASVFLKKELPAPAQDLSQLETILEYLDHDGILQLLQRCKVFETVDKTIIKQVRDIRNHLAHLPHLGFTTEEQQKKLLDAVANGVQNAVYGLLLRELYDDLANRVAEVINAKITARTVRLKREEEIIKGPDFQTVLKNIKDITISHPDAASDDGLIQN